MPHQEEILRLRALQNYAFQNVGRVFSLVRGSLQDFVQFFEFDQGNRVFFFFEQGGDGLAGHSVSFIFQPIYLDTVLKHIVMLLAQARQGVGELVRLLNNDIGQPGGGRRSARDLVHNQPNTRGIDEIQHVIERGSQAVDVFAIERRDEGLIELGENIVGHVVATVLDVLELLHAGFNVLEVLQQLLEQAGAVAKVAGHFGKHIEELRVSGNQTNHVKAELSWHIVNTALKSTEKYRMLPAIRSNEGSRSKRKGRR